MSLTTTSTNEVPGTNIEGAVQETGGENLKELNLGFLMLPSKYPSIYKLLELIGRNDKTYCSDGKIIFTPNGNDKAEITKILQDNKVRHSFFREITNAKDCDQKGCINISHREVCTNIKKKPAIRQHSEKMS